MMKKSKDIAPLSMMFVWMLTGALALAPACSDSDVPGPITPVPATSFQLEDLTQEYVLRAPDGSAVTLQPDSLQTASGGEPVLPITVTLRSVLDADSGPEDMPGGFDGVDASGAEVTLVSLGVAEVTLVDAANNKVTLKAGKPATLAVPALVKAQAEVPLWWLDDGGGGAVWREEGAAQLKGDAYVGEVAHFSFWNVDLPCPGPKGCVEGDLEVCGSAASAVSLVPASQLTCMNWRPGALTGGASKISGDTFEIRGLIPGNYTLRVMIDGAAHDQPLAVAAGGGCQEIGKLTFNCGGADAGPDTTADQRVADVGPDLRQNDGPTTDAPLDLAFDLGAPDMSFDISAPDLSGDAVADAGFPLQGPLSGSIYMTCPGPTSIGGTFDTTIDENGNLTGTAEVGIYGQVMTAVVTGTVDASGQVTANSSGSAGECNWSGTITRVSGANVGSGTFSCANGCSGTWEGRG